MVRHMYRGTGGCSNSVWDGPLTRAIELGNYFSFLLTWMKHSVCYKISGKAWTSPSCGAVSSFVNKFRWCCFLFLEEAILDLQAQTSLCCLKGSLISSVFTVTSSTGDYQPALNLKPLNQVMPTGPCHTGSFNDLESLCLQRGLSSKNGLQWASLVALGIQIS